ncbi:MAG: ASPIC/UnbV domain-containing protein [Pirellulaceae bacterium]
MSHSPSSQADVSIATDPESQFQQSLRHINQLLDSDGSLSGREPNCVFLNTRNGKFATASGVSGFDFPDDARALAVTDWDGDGDLDLWVTNRTGPRIRFLQNHLGEGRRFVAVKLQATKGNRDAIGARVEVVLQGNSESRLVRTLRAGEGFLSQSSKWLHFGLGDDSMERITVTWPDGSEQSISDVKLNSHLHITQGQSAVRYEDRRLDAAVFADHAPVVKEPEFDPYRIPLWNRIPLPRLDALLIDEDQAGRWHWTPGRPTLLTLWSITCAPCLSELTEFAQHANQFQAAGIDVCAIGVDGVLDDSPEDSRQRCLQVLRSMEFPFAQAWANEETVQRLQDIYSLPFAGKLDLPTPVSFLVEQSGRVAVIYRGAVTPSQVIADSKLLDKADAEWQSISLPFSGQWNVIPNGVPLLSICRKLAQRSHFSDAAEYVQRSSAELANDPDFAPFAVLLGSRLLAEGDNVETGKRLYRLASELRRSIRPC